MDLRLLCAEREPNSDLSRVLHDEVRQDAIEPTVASSGASVPNAPESTVLTRCAAP
jgi:hypothetical protein